MKKTKKINIEGNMFVRTNAGVIAKCINIVEDFWYEFDTDVYFDNYGADEPKYMEIPYNMIDEYVKTASFSILDIIEVGDYVNGRIVDDCIYLDKLGLIGLTELEIEDAKYIKSIVTHEKFKEMEYRIDE